MLSHGRGVTAVLAIELARAAAGEVVATGAASAHIHAAARRRGLQAA